jgi:hypothetical protein
MFLRTVRRTYILQGRLNPREHKVMLGGLDMDKPRNLAKSVTVE